MLTGNLTIKLLCICTLNILLEFRVLSNLLGSLHNSLFGKDNQIVCSSYTECSESSVKDQMGVFGRLL